ncbi:hypothetical protein BG004_007218, partial [Podila humilis]
MSEWRMMQMQLQQQDDLYFPLTLPSFNALSASNSQTRFNTPGQFGSIPVASAAPISATSSACSCGGCTGAMCGIGGVPNTPSTMAPSIGNHTPGPESPAVNKHSHNPFSSKTLSPWTPLYQQQPHVNHSFLSSPNQQQQQQQQHTYSMHSDNTSSGFFLQHEANGRAPGSTATLNSEYSPSSIDPSELENNVCGPSSAGSEAHLNQVLHHSFERPSSPSQQLRSKYCKSCSMRSRKPSMAVGTSAGPGSGSGRPPSPFTAGEPEIEFSMSNTGSSSSMRAASPGPFRSLSSKLAATTIRKLSVSQKSLFNASKDDLIGSGQGFLSDSGSKEHITQAESAGLVPAGHCTCHLGGGSTGSGEGALSPNKPFKTQSRLGGLRRKEKKNARKSREMDYNFSSQFVREEFAQYNYEKQIEDFQRAARVFKEQKALTTAAAAAAIATEARAAVAEASEAAAATAAVETAKVRKLQADKSFSSSSTSLAITPIQESAEEVPLSDIGAEKNSATSTPRQTTAHSSESAKIRKKNLCRPGLLRSMTRPHRRVGSSNDSVISSSGKKSQVGTSSRSMAGSRCSSIHNGKTDSSYLELGQVGMGMGMDLKLPGHGLPSGSNFGIDTVEGCEPTIINSKNAQTANSHSVFEHIPLLDMTKKSSTIIPTVPTTVAVTPVSSSPLLLVIKDMPNKPEDTLSFKACTSSVTQETRGHANQTGNARGRSIHSSCSVDTVSQQIAARHHQHSRLNNISSVASLHSPSQPLPPVSESGAITVGNASATFNGDVGCGGGGCGPGGVGGVCPNASANIVLENSPIQVVRATVGTVDDTSLPCFTFRMWVLSTMFVIMGAAISEYNFFRSNSAYFSVYFVQLASYFCGKFMARWLPEREFEIRIYGVAWLISKWRLVFGTDDTTETGVNSGHSDNNTLSCGGSRRVGTGVNQNSYSSEGPTRSTNRSTLSRSNITSTRTGPQSSSTTLAGRNKEYSWRFSLNPGKFNMKEHMLIGIAAAAGCVPAYATNVIAIQSLVFVAPLGNLTGAGLVVTSQCIGFSMAWFLFDYVIRPSVMIWPSTLVNVSLYNTLHEHKVLTRWFTRMQLFWFAFFAIFLYQWLPKMFMPVLASMAFLCWIKPSSNVLRKLGSGYVGLGMGCISLDWSIISGVGPLYTPWWAQCNFFVGLISMLWIVTPLVYFSNYWSAMSYPIVSSNLFDNNAELYDISRIVNKDLTFNLTMYEAYSPVIMTPYFAITYGTSFMAVVASFVHVALYYGSDIWLIAKTQCRRKFKRVKDASFSRSISGWSHSSHKNDKVPSSLPKEMGRDSRDHSSFGVASAPSLTLSALGPLPSLDMNTLDGSRRNSESVSYRADLEGGGAAGHGAEERPAFQQSSHYRQLSQQFDGYQPPVHHHSNRHQHSAQCEINREQIPTEMFGSEDIHSRLMRAYPEIPGFWFGALFIACFAAAIVVCNTSDIRLPVHALIVAILLAVVFALPMAIIQALSSSQIGLNVLSEVVCGYLL